MKTPKRHLYTLIISLSLLGLSMFCYRHFMMGVPLRDNDVVNTWTLEANLKFYADKNHPIKASFSIPYLPPHFSILDEYFLAPHYGISTHLSGQNRQVVWTLRRGTGQQSLYYRAILKESANASHPTIKPPVFKKLHLQEPEYSAAQAIIQASRQTSADIQTFAEALLNELKKSNGNTRVLVGAESSNLALVNSAIRILNQANILATSVHGIRSRHQSKAELETWFA
jgi:hypothetical protein